MEEFNETNRLLIGIEFGSVARQLLVAAGVEPSNDIVRDFVDAVDRDLLTFDTVEEAQIVVSSIGAIARASKELQDA